MLVLVSSFFCNGSVYPCNQTYEQSLRTDVHTSYLQYHMDKIPSLENLQEYKKYPRYPLYGPITWNPSWTPPDIHYVYLYVYTIGIYSDVTITVCTSIRRQDPTHSHITYSMQTLSLELAFLQIVTFSYLIRLTIST